MPRRRKPPKSVHAVPVGQKDGVHSNLWNASGCILPCSSKIPCICRKMVLCVGAPVPVMYSAAWRTESPRTERAVISFTRSSCNTHQQHAQQKQLDYIPHLPLQLLESCHAGSTGRLTFTTLSTLSQSRPRQTTCSPARAAWNGGMHSYCRSWYFVYIKTAY